MLHRMKEKCVSVRLGSRRGDSHGRGHGGYRVGMPVQIHMSREPGQT